MSKLSNPVYAEFVFPTSGSSSSSSSPQRCYVLSAVATDTESLAVYLQTDKDIYHITAPITSLVPSSASASYTKNKLLHAVHKALTKQDAQAYRYELSEADKQAELKVFQSNNNKLLSRIPMSASRASKSKSAAAQFRERQLLLLTYLYTIIEHNQGKVAARKAELQQQRLLISEKLQQLTHKVQQKQRIESDLFYCFDLLINNKKKEQQRGEQEYAELIKERATLLAAQFDRDADGIVAAADKTGRAGQTDEKEHSEAGETTSEDEVEEELPQQQHDAAEDEEVEEAAVPDDDHDETMTAEANDSAPSLRPVRRIDTEMMESKYDDEEEDGNPVADQKESAQKTDAIETAAPVDADEEGWERAQPVRRAASSRSKKPVVSLRQKHKEQQEGEDEMIPETPPSVPVRPTTRSSSSTATSNQPPQSPDHTLTQDITPVPRKRSAAAAGIHR